MDAREFRRHAHALVDWMAEFLETLEERPVRAQIRPGEIASRLPDSPPEAGEPFEAIMADFERDVLPGVTHWQHPRFFAYFPANSSPPSVLGEMLTAALGAQCMLWETSPAATEMETRVLDWLRRMTGLPEGFHGVIQDSASSATLAALLVARERASEGRTNTAGLHDAPAMTVYASAEAHSSVVKGARIAGYGADNVRAVPVDDAFAMRPDTLAAMIAEDRVRGRVPACVVATLGTTGVGAIDPLAAIGEVAARDGIYLHVDAAWAGSALLLPEHSGMIEGIGQVDSFVFNPHKWLFTNFDCSAYFVRDPAALTGALAISPPYLETREGDQVIDYRDWSVPLGRRFRALKLWFVIRSYGIDRLRAMVREHIRLAAVLEHRIAAEPDFEPMAPRSLALLNFRYRPAGLDDGAALDALNARLLDAINDDGFIYLTRNVVCGRAAIRFSIGQTATETRHVDEAWARITKIARALRPS